MQGFKRLNGAFFLLDRVVPGKMSARYVAKYSNTNDINYLGQKTSGLSLTSVDISGNRRPPNGP